MIWMAAVLLLSSPAALAQEESGGQYVRCVAFYNLENLFDTIHDEGKNDYEYLPDGGMKWTAYKYENKVKNMAYAVSQLGTDYDPRGAACIGVAEVETTAYYCSMDSLTVLPSKCLSKSSRRAVSPVSIPTSSTDLL